MQSIQQVIDYNIQMHEIALEIQATDKIMQGIPEQGAAMHAGVHVVSAMIQDAAEIITRLIKQHRELSKLSFEALREFEMRGAGQMDFTTKPMPIVYAYGETDQQNSNRYKIAAMCEHRDGVTLVTPVNKNAA